jgi:hypothetical protein
MRLPAQYGQTHHGVPDAQVEGRGQTDNAGTYNCDVDVVPAGTGRSPMGRLQDSVDAAGDAVAVVA